MDLSGLYQRADNIKWSNLIIAIASLLVSLFFQFPNITYLKEQVSGEKNYMWHAVEMQAEHPFTKVEHKAGSHEEKKVFRLTLPIIGHLLGLKTLGLYLFQALLGFFSFWISAILIKRITGDTVAAALFTIALSCVYFGCSAFIDVFGFTDSTAYFFLLLAILWRNPLIIFLAVFAASWADERGLIASSFVFLWFSLIDEHRFQKLTDVLKISKETIAVVAAWVVYFVSRFTYSSVLGIETKTGGIERAFIESVSKIQLSLWSGYEAFWLLLALFAIVAIVKRHYWLLIIVAGGYFIVAAVALNVFDTTKSMAYGSIGLFVLMGYLAKFIELDQLRRYIAAIAVLCILAPTIFIINTIMYTTTLYQEFFQFIIVRLR